MVRKLKPVIHVGDGSLDTRGLPASVDPRHFYEYRIEKLAKEATGLESLLYRIIPFSYIQSFCIAIDPLYKFKVSPTRVAVPNRVLTRYGSAMVTKRTLIGEIRTTTKQAKRLGFCPTLGTTVTENVTPYNVSYAGNSIDRYVYIEDSTRRTRPLGVSEGECKIVHFTNQAPSRNVYYTDKILSESYGAPGVCPIIRDWSTTDTIGHVVLSPGATVTLTNAMLVRQHELLRADYYLQTKGLDVVRRAIPTSRHQSLLRNIIELKDIPRSVLSLRNALLDFRHLYESLPDKSIRDAIFSLSGNIKRVVPNEYLSYQFGWRQLYSDIMSALFQPSKVGKRINSLISKAGKRASFSSSIKFLDDDQSAIPPYVIAVSGWDFGPTKVSTHATREVTIRSKIYGNFPFPHVDLPKFRQELFAKMLGENITPGDLYDLTPWTWLVDWFSGLGNYLHIIQEINDDPTLIDHGFVSYEAKTSIVQSYQYTEKDAFYWVRNLQVIENHQDRYDPKTFDFPLDVKTYVRKDASTLQSISSPAGTLSLFQQTILGALFARRI